jgi:hypothetical protein
MDRHFYKRKDKCKHSFLNGLHAFGYKTIAITREILRLLINLKTARYGEKKVFRYYCETDRISKNFIKYCSPEQRESCDKRLFTSHNSEDSVLILK